MAIIYTELTPEQIDQKKSLEQKISDLEIAYSEQVGLRNSEKQVITDNYTAVLQSIQDEISTAKVDRDAISGTVTIS